MRYLSRDDIEKIAEGVICQYKEQYLPERRMCYMVEATELAEMLGFRIEYVHITRDGSILGETSSGRIWTEVFDDNMNKMFFELDGSTILVDKRLLSNPRIVGRKNFTIAHEIAHQIINRRDPEMCSAVPKIGFSVITAGRLSQRKRLWIGMSGRQMHLLLLCFFRWML